MNISSHWRQWKPAIVLAGLFLVCWWLPTESPRFHNGLIEAFALTQWYVREHVLLCLLPALFIAGAIASFISQGSVMKYLGAGANRLTAYGVASISGTILAVCSCTVLPLFGGIYRMGAGIGPATAFLYAGPAISALAIVMSAKVLGLELGLARGIAAIVFSLMIGLIMTTLFRRDEKSREVMAMQCPEDKDLRPLSQTAAFFAVLVSILVFANWARSDQPLFNSIFLWKWPIVSFATVLLLIMLGRWFGASWPKIIIVASAITLAATLFTNNPQIPFAVGMAGLTWLTASSPNEGPSTELREWWLETWNFTRLVTPLLLAGVFIAGLLLGRPGQEAWIPSHWIASALGGDGVAPILFASVAGALMYFATLTEIPIVEALQGSGMGQGAALALLLAGPALSLPNMLVIHSIIGWKKTLSYVTLVIIFSTLAGVIIGPYI